MTIRQRLARILDPRTADVGPKALVTTAFVKRYTCLACSGHGHSIAPVPDLHPQRLQCPTCGIRMRPDIDIKDVRYPVVIDSGIVAQAVRESNT